MRFDDNKSYAQLTTEDGTPCPLKNVSITGSIDNTLTTFSIRQTYANDTKKPIEALYTFPIPINATLLDMQAHFGERTLQGTVMASKTAKKKYNEAIEEGNAAILLDEVDAGLYNASFGNLKPGETATIEYRYAIQHTWNDRFLRVYLPTTIAPRYGDPADAGLSKAATPEFVQKGDVAWSFTIDVTGKPAQCAVSCPNHNFTTQTTENGLQLSFVTLPDRDVVLDFESQERPNSVATCGKDRQGWVVAADFMPHFQSERTTCNLDIIVDCSGSMEGTSIAQAREGLRLILESLSDGDSFNITAYGSDFRSLFEGRTKVDGASLQKAHDFLKTIDADMGGTETAKALRHVYETHGGSGQRTILLITDGEIWSSNAIYKEARASGCIVMTVGVGFAVAEKTLKKLAEETGGKCEYVSPEEDMARRIHRHCMRITRKILGDIRIDAEGAASVSPEKIQTVFDGDTVHIFATYANKPAGQIVLSAKYGNETYSWSCPIPEISSADEDIPLSDIARISVAERLRNMRSKDAMLGTQLATDYQLLSKWTSYFLVDVRPEDERPDTLPESVKVPQMLARGWHGAPYEYQSTFQRCASRPRAMQCLMLGGSFQTDSCLADAEDAEFDIPEFIRGQNEPEEPEIMQNLASFMTSYSENCQKPRSERKSMTSLADLEALGLPKDIADALRKLITNSLPEEEIVILLLVHLLTVDGVSFSEDAEKWIDRCASRVAISAEHILVYNEVDSLLGVPA